MERLNQVIFLSATPAKYELQVSTQVVEQIVRPTGLVDPEVIIKPTKGQIDDLMVQIEKRVTKGDRVLVTTLTKKMAEDLTDYLLELGVRVRYLHSEVDTIQRIEILRDLRLGEFDVLVGINLLREGLDLPEVSLVAILDADKEGFLRSETSLIQMIGRAARNVDGQVVMYADRVTDSMQRAVSETNRRRGRQEAYNAEHGIDPQTIRKAVTDILASLRGREGTPDARQGPSLDPARQAAGRPRRTAPRRVAPPDPHLGRGDEPGRDRPPLRIRRSPPGRDQGPEAGTSRGRIGASEVNSAGRAADSYGVRPKQRRLVAVAHVTAAVMGLAFLPSNCWADVHLFWRKFTAMGWHHLPYRDFLWEFPPFTVPLVALSRVMAVNGFATVFAAVSAAASYGTWRLLVRLRPDDERTVTIWWFACGIPLFTIAWYRFDAVTVFFACLALVAYAEGRRADGPVIAGFGFRLWPIVLVVIPFVRRRRADVARCLGLAAVVVSAWYAFSPSGFGDFLQYRKGAGYEVESVFGSIGLVAGRVPEFVSGAWVVRLGLLDHLDQVLTVAWVALVVASAVVVRRRGEIPSGWPARSCLPCW